MILRTAKGLLASLWLGASLIFLLILVVLTPGMGAEAAEVWKRAPTFVAPVLALVVSFLFGLEKPNTKTLPNPFSYYAALTISAAHIFTLYFSVFFWKPTILDNLEAAGLFMHYFSALSIAALNFFLLGIAAQTPQASKKKKTPTPPGV